MTIKFLTSHINIAMKKVRRNMTAGILRDNYKKAVTNIIANDQGFLFIYKIKRSLAMIRQLGYPTFFWTLS